jgi:hypothetical protein
MARTPSIRARAYSHDATKAPGEPESPEKETFPRRFPRLGAQFQTKLPKSTEPLDRPPPERFSTEYPHITETEAKDKSLGPNGMYLEFFPGFWTAKDPGKGIPNRRRGDQWWNHGPGWNEVRITSLEVIFGQILQIYTLQDYVCRSCVYRKCVVGREHRFLRRRRMFATNAACNVFVDFLWLQSTSLGIFSSSFPLWYHSQAFCAPLGLCFPVHSLKSPSWFRCRSLSSRL